MFSRCPDLEKARPQRSRIPGMNKILRLQVELIPAPRREDGKTYKGILERTVSPKQPDDASVPTNYIVQLQKLAAGFVVPDGVYTMRCPDGSELVRVQGGTLMHVEAKAAGE
jgi:hypothetical protein